MKILLTKNNALSILPGLLAAFTLSGCGGLAANFSAAASMRVEVEVYKGPLSKSVESQWGEFVGMVNEASDAFATFNDGRPMGSAAFDGVNLWVANGNDNTVSKL